MGLQPVVLGLRRGKVILPKETKVLFTSLIVGREYAGYAETSTGLIRTHSKYPRKEKAIGY